MSRILSVVTPENVEVNFELAGLGTRFLAALLDYIVVGLTAGLLGGAFVTLWASQALSGPWLIASVVLLVFVIDWCYFIGFEAGRNGQTPGKRYMGLRVLRDGGFPLDLRSAMLRNFLRPVDFLPSLYCAGTIAIFISPTDKRLGDMAAGTVVVKERRSDEPVHAQLTPSGRYGFDITSRLTDQDRAVLREYVDRSVDIDDEVRQAIGAELASKLSTHVGTTIEVNDLPLLLADAG